MTWFDEGCPKLLDQRKDVKLQEIHDPGQISRDNINNVGKIFSNQQLGM
jgi:hypothetical protein